MEMMEKALPSPGVSLTKSVSAANDMDTPWKEFCLIRKFWPKTQENALKINKKRVSLFIIINI